MNKNFGFFILGLLALIGGALFGALMIRSKLKRDEALDFDDFDEYDDFDDIDFDDEAGEWGDEADASDDEPFFGETKTPGAE